VEDVLLPRNRRSYNDMYALLVHPATVRHAYHVVAPPHETHVAMTLRAASADTSCSSCSTRI
jgi:hypothetical protein